MAVAPQGAERGMGAGRGPRGSPAAPAVSTRHLPCLPLRPRSRPRGGSFPGPDGRRSAGCERHSDAGQLHPTSGCGISATPALETPTTAARPPSCTGDPGSLPLAPLPKPPRSLRGRRLRFSSWAPGPTGCARDARRPARARDREEGGGTVTWHKDVQRCGLQGPGSARPHCRGLQSLLPTPVGPGAAVALPLPQPVGALERGAPPGWTRRRRPGEMSLKLNVSQNGAVDDG